MIQLIRNDYSCRGNKKGCGLEDIIACNDVHAATELLTKKITTVLDLMAMAPIKKIKTRKKYALLLSKEPKELKRSSSG